LRIGNNNIREITGLKNLEKPGQFVGACSNLTGRKTMKYRIMIAEDHTLLREGLRSMISSVPDFEVVAEARDGKEALRTALTAVPDLIMMDMSMPHMNGIEATLQIKRRNPGIRIIALTIYKSQDYVREALKAGVDGYVLKDATYEELIVAIRSVLSGKKFLSPDVSSQVVSSYLNAGSSDNSLPSWDNLTPRERSIVKLVAEGHTNRSTAEFLNVSPKTVEKHRSSLMHKLGIKTATELVILALEQGWVEREHMKNYSDLHLPDKQGDEKPFDDTLFDAGSDTATN
jgi:DNA-binding NarL/FixJ family response regulator